MICPLFSNFEEELPKLTVGKLSADSGATVYQRATDRSIPPYNISEIISLLEQSTNRTYFMVAKLTFYVTNKTLFRITRPK